MEHTIQVQKEDMIFNVLSIGEVKSGETASATITGKEPNQVLNLTLPKGEKGDIGVTGGTGPKGNDGHTPVRGTDYWTTSDKQEIVSDVVSEIDIPSKTSDLTNDSGFITNNANDLANYELKPNTGTKISLSIDNSNYVMTLNLKNSNDDILSTQSIDLPLETMVVNATYDNATKEIVLTLQNGNTTRFSVSDLISGLAKTSDLPTKLSQLQNDSGFITGYTETDPTVPSYVKSITEENITSWNGKDTLPEIGSYSLLANTANISGKPNNYVIYAIASSNNTIAKRSAVGTLKANNAVESNDLVTLSQLNAIFTLEGTTLNITTANPSTISEEV